MVSIRFLYLNFIYIPNLNKTHPRYGFNILMFSRTVTPVKLFPELTLKFNNFINSLKSTPNPQHHEFVTDVLDLIAKSTNPNLNSILSQHNFEYEDRKNVFKLLVDNWNGKGIPLTIDKLFSLNKVIKGLELDPLTVSEILNTPTNDATISNTKMNVKVNDVKKNNVKMRNEDVERILLFNDLFGAPDFINSLTISHPNINTLNTKKNLLGLEFERMLDFDLNDYLLENPRYLPDLKDVPSLVTIMKQQITEIFGENSSLFRDVTDHDLVSLSISLSELIWEYNYYRHRAKPRISTDVMELLRVDKPLCDDVFAQLVDSRINEIKLIKIPNIVDKPVYSHPLKIFPTLYQLQFQQSLKDFNHWFQHSIDSLLSDNDTLGTVNTEDAVWKYPRAVEEIGGVRPYVRFISDDPGVPPSAGKFPRKFVQRVEGDFEYLTVTPEDRKEFDKVEEDMKMFQHMSQDELAKHFIRKFKSEYQYAKRIKSRLHTLKLLNPNNSTHLTHQMYSEFTQQMGSELTGDTSNDFTGDTSNDFTGDTSVSATTSKQLKTPLECVNELSDVLTGLNYHLMNVRHMSWHLECAGILPVECLYNIKQMGCTITNPKPRTLFFFSHNFLKAFNTITQFTTHHSNSSDTDVVSGNQVFKTGGLSESMRDRVRLFFEAYNSSKSRIPVENDTTSISDDPDYKLNDSELLSAMVKSGAGMRISGELPFGMRLENIDRTNMTPQLAQSSLYRLTISQPDPSYRCKQCNYTVYGHYINLAKGKTIVCYEFEQVRDDPDYKCRNCGATRDHFEIVYRTAERHYELPPYIHFQLNPKFRNVKTP
ncbi:hypothetical protein TpMuguga_03g00305 [Theileria parva strain Muguga]|uniref:Uncharacterized protein n=1 Tax=Theileria parva TaxID=5875 RepID=Q4N049_THEPA|nr:uncharacterized protein TpMuguga_03g00305 [Theileria parva strain Muguga]EAN31040.1 hypothetical protein TpMuguga_03g00305 [Theileria parva strain Muguga]|eukprot:XP_763323.1 hypothetical protein [Theileria parva strain Muguga]